MNTFILMTILIAPNGQQQLPVTQAFKSHSECAAELTANVDAVKKLSTGWKMKYTECVAVQHQKGK